MSEMEDAMIKLSSLFSLHGKGDTYAFSLNCWTDGMWSVKVTDNWHKWLDEKIPELNYKYATPLQAVKAFLEHVEKNKIDVKSLQGE